MYAPPSGISVVFAVLALLTGIGNLNYSNNALDSIVSLYLGLGLVGFTSRWCMYNQWWTRCAGSSQISKLS